LNKNNTPTFADIHCHALFGSDDGAKSAEMMQEMIDKEYEEGVRYLCFTPHYHPGYYGYNEERTESAFALALEYCKKYPDMKLSLANELHYGPEAISWMKEKACRTVSNTRFVLVDFKMPEEEAVILKGLSRLSSAGFVPILAHAERYSALSVSAMKALKQNGVLIQANTASIFGGYGFNAKNKLKKMLALHLVDFLSTDAHNLTDRAPRFSDCYLYVAKKHGADYANYICRDNAVNRFFSRV
jgi:protein-tyrosine phosphatase